MLRLKVRNLGTLLLLDNRINILSFLASKGKQIDF